MSDKKELYKAMAVAEWRRQLENNEGVASLYRSFFPDSSGEWDKIIESYIREIAWVGFSVSENSGNFSEEDIKEAVKSAKSASNHKNNSGDNKK